MTEIIKYENGLIPSKGNFRTEDLIDQFLLETQEVKDSTKKRYRKSLKKYFEWVAANGLDIKAVILPDILRYKQHLQDIVLNDKTGLSSITVGSYLVVVRLFYAWANSRGFPHNPAATLKSPKKSNKYGKKPIPQEDMARLFEYFQGKSKRDLAIANTLYYCGLRCMELCGMNFSDIKVDSGKRILWVKGKGKSSKDNWVGLKDEVFALIEDWAKERGILPEGDIAIFVSEDPIKKGNRLTPESVSRIIKTGLRAIGLRGREFSAHSLRHSAGTNLTDAGASIEQVQEFLRHANSQTSRGYAREALERKRLQDDIGKLL